VGVSATGGDEGVDGVMVTDLVRKPIDVDGGGSAGTVLLSRRVNDVGRGSVFRRRSTVLQHSTSTD